MNEEYKLPLVQFVDELDEEEHVCPKIGRYDKRDKVISHTYKAPKDFFVVVRDKRKGPVNKYGPKLHTKEVVGIEYTKYMNGILRDSPSRVKF